MLAAGADEDSADTKIAPRVICFKELAMRLRAVFPFRLLFGQPLVTVGGCYGERTLNLSILEPTYVHHG